MWAFINAQRISGVARSESLVCSGFSFKLICSIGIPFIPNAASIH